MLCWRSHTAPEYNPWIDRGRIGEPKARRKIEGERLALVRPYKYATE